MAVDPGTGPPVLDYRCRLLCNSHRVENHPFDVDYSWSNGVRVWSEQTWLTAFARVRF